MAPPILCPPCSLAVGLFERLSFGKFEAQFAIAFRVIGPVTAYLDKQKQMDGMADDFSKIGAGLR